MKNNTVNFANNLIKVASYLALNNNTSDNAAMKALKLAWECSDTIDDFIDDINNAVADLEDVTEDGVCWCGDCTCKHDIENPFEDDTEVTELTASTNGRASIKTVALVELAKRTNADALVVTLVGDDTLVIAPEDVLPEDIEEYSDDETFAERAILNVKDLGTRPSTGKRIYQYQYSAPAWGYGDTLSMTEYYDHIEVALAKC